MSRAQIILQRVDEVVGVGAAIAAYRVNRDVKSGELGRVGSGGKDVRALRKEYKGQKSKSKAAMWKDIADLRSQAGQRKGRVSGATKKSQRFSKKADKLSNQ